MLHGGSLCVDLGAFAPPGRRAYKEPATSTTLDQSTKAGDYLHRSPAGPFCMASVTPKASISIGIYHRAPGCHRQWSQFDADFYLATRERPPLGSRCGYRAEEAGGDAKNHVALLSSPHSRQQRPRDSPSTAPIHQSGLLLGLAVWAFSHLNQQGYRHVQPGSPFAVGFCPPALPSSVQPAETYTPLPVPIPRTRKLRFFLQLASSSTVFQRLTHPNLIRTCFSSSSSLPTQAFAARPNDKASVRYITRIPAAAATICVQADSIRYDQALLAPAERRPSLLPCH
ncbi:hypothetical protein MAPG_09160 [Magnaporthiopsis poae ATCC 64411]|uniref:Uncharacterized protein n=1 Tax=Magnaporthiopsis poae (strain ATCC 64411 / 73-15) TaxID=644358 RepID=A0A0C4E981_MAGP6|nr:hypothetical protein MAPG_09160 [Magnaporthiopsis poae ATCC 64411]